MGNLNSGFFFAALAIVLTDVVLAGDNAVVIALAVKSLPRAQRRTGAMAGAAGAVILRVALTFFAARILRLPFLMLTGGLLIFWIAVKLLVSGTGEQETVPAARSLRQAIWMVLMADVTMSVDNILAVAALSKDNLALLIAGLGLSISLVVFTSSMLSQVMDRYPILVWLGAAILGRVAGEMVVTDPWMAKTFSPPSAVVIAGEVGGAALVLLAGWLLKKRNTKPQPPLSQLS
jgi:YjbE family integral membrane protein